MFEMSAMMTRLVARQLHDEEGNPKDDAVISISRLHQFMRPFFYRKQTDQGFEIRLEWLGYYETASGKDVFAVEAVLRERVLAHFSEDSKQFTVHRNS